MGVEPIQKYNLKITKIKNLKIKNIERRVQSPYRNKIYK